MNIQLNNKLISNLGDVLGMPTSEMIAATVTNRSTWYRIMHQPEVITVQQLLAISNGLHIPVRRFFSSGKADFIGKKSDYVTDPYLPCHYEAETLQEFVSTRPSATWKHAAKVTGMSRDNLRNSLLAIRRTPVTRFLAVCNAFEVDPFSILSDPNPRHHRQKGQNKDDENLKAEITAMRKEIQYLSSAVDELTKKYETLLADHNDLAKRVNINSVNIQNFTDSHLSIAADHLDPH